MQILHGTIWIASKGVLLGGLLCAASIACAQDHNLGYYAKIHQLDDIATYELIGSEQIPGLENEPPLQDDLQIPKENTGDWCDPVSGTCFGRDEAAGATFSPAFRARAIRSLQRSLPELTVEESPLLPGMLVLDAAETRAPAYLTLWPVDTVTLEELGYVTDEAADDMAPRCFSDDQSNRSRVETFLASCQNEERRMVIGMYNEYDKGDIELLRDPDDAIVCAIFNRVYTDLVTLKQVEAEHFSEEFKKLLDPDAYAMKVSYYRVGEFYFVSMVSTQPQSKDPDKKYASTGGSSLLHVHDRNLNLIAVNMRCPGYDRYCPPDLFEETKRKYSATSSLGSP